MRKLSFEKLKEHRDTPKTALRILGLVWKIDKWLFLGALIATIIPAVMPFITAYVAKLIIDYVVARVSGQNLPLTDLYLLIAVGAGVFFLQNMAFRTQEYINSLLWTKIPISLNQMIFAKTASLDMQYFEDSQFKDLLEKVRDSYNYRTQQYVQTIFFLIQNIVQVTIAAFSLIHLNFFLLFVIVLIAIPEFINEIVQSRLSYGIWDANTKHRKRFWYLSHLLQNAWSVKEIKLFSLGEKFLHEVKTIQTKFYKDNARLAKRTYSINIVLNIFSTLFVISIQLFILLQALSQKITIGDITFYQTVISNFQNGLGGLFSNLNRVFENSLYIKSLFDLFDTEPVVKEKKNAVSLTLTKPPLIEFKNVTFSYPGKKDSALHNFSLTIKPGEKIALVGENGAGKSTIIKLLARFYDLEKGEILINGVNIKDLKLTSLYSILGILFQDFNRYEDTVKDNIKYGLIDKKAREDRVKQAAVSAGADEFIKSFDKTYEQMLGRTFENGVELSTGQWQKIALARAFFRDAFVLVLDEPTASIDAKAEAEIFERVEKLSRDKTVLIISHRFSTVRNADTIYVIDKGNIAESGSHKELMKKNGQYAKLFTLQAKRYQD